ncbi:MAG: hypothetical protein HQK78_05610 [Desulfobacterales bacterium]|nr:hypothetical protein [Desulfobacterales bacterium]
MPNKANIDVSYFPGCSMGASGNESNASLLSFCKNIGFNLIELKDWSCCGSSSAHSVDAELAFNLATRNLAIAPSTRPLLIACPNCLLRLRQAYIKLKNDKEYLEKYEKKWGKRFEPNLEIWHFFELIDNVDFNLEKFRKLSDLKFVSYYGCMLNRPPDMRYEKNYYGFMERILSTAGGVPVRWSYASRCCGTFLAAVRPEAVTEMVNKIMKGAIDVGAECIVTACMMCHMNLEIRCTIKRPIPIFHLSELLSFMSGSPITHSSMSKHIIDPMPLLRAKGLIR